MVHAAEYQTYYAFHLDHLTESWGGQSFHKILTKDTQNVNFVYTGSTSLNNAVEFLYPLLVQSKYALDGIADGHFTLYNYTASGSTISAFLVTLLALPESGSARTLASQSVTFDSAITIDTGEYLTLPISMNIDKQAVNAKEKLILRFEITGGENRIALSHELTADESGEYDILIRFPYAPTE